VPEIVAGLAGGEASSERADPAVEMGKGALSDPTQTGLEFAEWHLDGVQRGQIAECGAARFDRLAYARNFVRRKVVVDDDVVALERWRETG
jgi:hypothetical protein